MAVVRERERGDVGQGRTERGGLERGGIDRGVVLFDLDGTITDPAAGITSSMQKGLAAVGVDAPSADELRRHIGPPLWDSFADMGVPADRIDAAVAGYREHYTAGAMFDAPVYDGMAELIGTLADEGRTLAIATSKPTGPAEQILIHHDLRDRMTFVGGATLDRSRITKTDVIAHTLAALGHPDPDDVVMIGDRSVDIDGGHDHGLATIGVEWGFGEPGELAGAEPGAIVQTAAELGELLAAGGRPESWRRAARALIVDTDSRVLLVRWQPGPMAVWLSPGGGLQPGERSDEAARRELAEELGRHDLDLGPFVCTRTFPFGESSNGWAGQREAWYLVRTEGFDPGDISRLPGADDDRLTTARWWTLDEIRNTDERVSPAHLADAVERVIDKAWDGLATDISTARVPK